MSRRSLVLVLVGVLLGVLGWWLTTNFGFTTERVFVGYRGEARHNFFFAAELLLERMGKQVTRRPTLTVIDELPEGASAILPDYRADLDPPRVEALLAWVERGGRLIFGMEMSPLTKDPFLEAIGVSAQEVERRAPDRSAPRRAHEAVTLPDGRVLRADLDGSVILFDEGAPAAWRHTGPEGDRILAFERGAGRIVVLSTLLPFGNTRLNELDHAALLWHFVEDAGPRVVLVKQLSSVSLLDWLLDHALPALAALAALIAFWLWRVIPRFGPLQPGETAQRRSLLEHLRAVGRFQADQRQLGRLLQQVRDEAQAAFARAAPLAAALDGPARLREASRLTRLRPRELMQAFTGAVSTRHEFSNTVRVLAAFRRRLARATHRDESR